MPARLSDIKRALLRFDVELVDGSGKHPFKAVYPGVRAYPIPAHNGLRTEITDLYIRGLCRNFGIDLEEFKKHL